MTPKQTLVNFPEFCNSGTKVAPEAAKYAAGYQPADVLPAEHLNYFENKSSAGITALNEGVESIENELVTLVEAAGATPSASTNNQVLNAVNYLINIITGTLTNLVTTAKTNLVAAINEVKNGLTSHTTNTSNPHNVTKSQIGLGNVTNVATDDALNKTSTNNIQNKVVTSNIATVLNTQGQTATKTVTVEGATLYDGLTLKICFKNGHSGSSFTLNLNSLGAKTIYVNRNGSVVAMTAHTINSVNWYIQKYTTLELIYDTSLGGWLVLGNPEVISYSDETTGYRIKANGFITQWARKSYVTTPTNNYIVTLPVAFSDTSYHGYAMITDNSMTSYSYPAHFYWEPLSKSQFKLGRAVPIGNNWCLEGY